MANFRVLTGDNSKLLKKLAANSVDSCVCDPPYELGFMGKPWDKTGIANSVELWREVLRVLKPGGHLLAFGGTRTYHRMVCAIEDAGFEIRDQIGWLYGSGFPKSLDVSKAIDKASGAKRKAINGHVVYGDGHIQRNRTKRNKSGRYNYTMRDGIDPDPKITAPATTSAKKWQGWGTALKPAWEPIVLARKPLTQRTVAENVQRFGTGAINVDGCRVEGAAGKGVWGSSNKTVDPDRTFVCSPGAEQYRTKQHSNGRWPANVIHDGSDEVLAEFAKFGELRAGVAVRRNKGVSGAGWKSIGYSETRGDVGFSDTGTAARFFYCAKASKRDRDEGLNGEVKSPGECTARKNGSAGLNSPRAGAGRTTGSRNNHPTVKPTALMRYLCKLVTPKGGTVLDPFTGSGSTGKAAVLEGFSFIGCELSKEYSAIAKARISAAVHHSRLSPLEPAATRSISYLRAPKAGNSDCALCPRF